MCRHGYPLRQCLWVKVSYYYTGFGPTIICKGFGLACTSMFSTYIAPLLVILDSNEQHFLLYIRGNPFCFLSALSSHSP